MRLSLVCLVIVLAAGWGRAHEPVGLGTFVTPELATAYRDNAVARQQLIRYRQVTLPLKRQAVAAAIEQTRWEIALLNRRLRDYAPALRVGEFSPARTAAENDMVYLNAALQHLRMLQDEEIALMRFSGATDELYQYDVVRAELRVQAARAATRP